MLVSLCKAKIRTYDANLVLLPWSISPHAYMYLINVLKIESKSDKNGNTNITLKEMILFQMVSSFSSLSLCEMAHKYL